MRFTVVWTLGVALFSAHGALAQDNPPKVPRPGEGVSAPVLVREVKPNYPAQAMGDGKQGVVTLVCVVNADGKVGDVRVVGTLHPLLDEAAVNALKQWHFKPGTRNGKPVRVEVDVEMSFTLRNKGPRLGSAEVFKPGNGVLAPRLVKETKPSYTADAIRARIEGTVLVDCVIRADGTVGDMRVAKPLHPELDGSALKSVSEWRFEPGTKDGKPVPVQVTVEVTFRLRP